MQGDLQSVPHAGLNYYFYGQNFAFMDKEMKIRQATRADVAAMLAIYAPYVEHTSVTFETELPALEQFTERVRSYQEKAPWLVCEINGVVAGYAYASSYRERLAYQWSIECSVYIHDSCHRQGVGRSLYKVLFSILKKQGFRNVYAVINLPNEQSVALHESMGFTYFATYEQVGYKLGKWKNVGWWRLVLNEFDQDPAAPVYLKDVDPAVVEDLLLRRSE